ncbi:MAG: DUF805 domain-containing protein [Candidatus Krumholzibacteria bacterium]|nr:DUF805 domain-containing protein [Candidatus Krumholzibacteria bacterium]MDH4336749.1 DUF805 domain-containing protein [Candidatus Krumholzibacteria bacterium]MDH5270476.1 DUF805 domain-containing protein [Candidatus Krumholzibacteria bacterium]
MSNVFTMQGRLSRKQYVIYSMMIMAVTYACAFAVGFASGVSGSGVEAAGALGFLIGALGCAAQAFIAVRRLHDLGKPGWHYWLFFVPFYNIYLGLILLFTRGASGSNQYGPDPATA